MVLNAFQMVRPRGAPSNLPPPTPSNGCPRAVQQLTLDGRLIKTWRSGWSAATELWPHAVRSGAAAISKCANHGANTALGFKWRFAEVHPNGQ